MPEFEIEYLDDLGQDREAGPRESARRPVLSDDRLAGFVGIVGWIVAGFAVIVAIALALSYVPATGGPGSPGPYIGDSGVPLGLDAILGLIGLVLGLGLVALGRLIANTAITASRLAAIEHALNDHGNDGSAAEDSP
jgi:hypothetical protein